MIAFKYYLQCNVVTKESAHNDVPGVHCTLFVNKCHVDEESTHFPSSLINLLGHEFIKHFDFSPPPQHWYSYSPLFEVHHPQYLSSIHFSLKFRSRYHYLNPLTDRPEHSSYMHQIAQARMLPVSFSSTYRYTNLAHICKYVYLSLLGTGPI